MRLLFLLLAAVGLFSFHAKNGGDICRIYLNGKLAHEQFVHADNSLKTVRLASFGDGDRVDVFFSHCGTMGKGRTLTFRNEKNEAVKVLKFADAAGNNNLMRFTRKDLNTVKEQQLRLYYRANELPEGRLLAVLTWNSGQSLASR